MYVLRGNHNPPVLPEDAQRVEVCHWQRAPAPAPHLIVVQHCDTEKLTAACEAPSANVWELAGDSGGTRKFR